jgi:2-amino-4-hydroxy-6-hydroxymethyldihydropteridine diphosphokinase/dihydropteroate synthase
MVILGLGSNLNDKLANLRQALSLIKQINGLTVTNVSPVYMSDAMMPDNAPKNWDVPYLNAAIRCDTSLEPAALRDQLKTIEDKIGRSQQERWAPRIIDIDILAWDDLVINSDALTIPHKGLLDRPFALWPLADIAPFWLYQGKTAAQWVEPLGSRFSGDGPFHTRQIYQRIDTPELVGVINVTPDSFADGGKFLTVDKAVQQALHLVYSGATVLDIGAESTSPTAIAISSESEWERLEPVLDAIISIKNTLLLPPKISIDTRHAEIAENVLANGVDWINDVSGLDDPKMRSIIASSKADCVVMHHLSIPERRDHVLPRDQDPIKIVLEWAEQRLTELEKQGIARDRVIFDPGIGFGKMAEQSLELLRHVSAFSKLGARVLIGPSRKSYLSILTDAPFSERDIETSAISLFLAKQPIDYLRVHNVEYCARTLRVGAALD